MEKRMLARAAAVIAAVAAFFSAGQARGGERYYLMIFGSQSHPKLLRYTHTWATFIRVVGEGDDPSGYQVYQHTISWLPATLNVRTWSPVPEQGVNLDLYATLDTVLKNGENVTMWGPYEVHAPIY